MIESVAGAIANPIPRPTMTRTTGDQPAYPDVVVDSEEDEQGHPDEDQSEGHDDFGPQTFDQLGAERSGDHEHDGHGEEADT